ncbi:hypothetical protein [Solimonas terrae]|uniref:DUF3313 domain-containing protein n=1 Tax=Solimonas terrae TaxID=1396819 RepID=A0A6M2BNW3_9GAMM|nr:hypothetical protein [Solimonas terrae]NGY04168.1 hypothetical protein [Solimonas terrae]
MKAAGIIVWATMLAVTSLAGTAALADDGAAAAATDTAALAAGGNAGIGLPDIDADTYFDGAEGGTFGKKVSKLLGHSNRVAVAGFRVVFITEADASASVRPSYLPGRDTTGAHASIHVSVDGVDNATRQAITDRAYANLLAALKAAGREVVPASELQPLFARLELTPSSVDAPYSKSAYGRTGVAFSPSGMPMWWWSALDGWGNLGAFGQHNMRTVPEFSKDLNAYVISPTFVVDFAQLSSSGNHSGLAANSAEVGVSLRIAVTDMITGLVRADEVKGGLTASGDDAYIRLTKPFTTDLSFADLAETESRKTTGFMALMTGSSKSKSTQVATTDDARYSAAANATLDQATGALARFFQQHAP